MVAPHLCDVSRCSVLTPSLWGTAECCRHRTGAATPIDLKFASQWVCQQFSGFSTSFVTWQQFVDMQVSSFKDLQSAVNLWSRRERLQMGAEYTRCVVSLWALNALISITWDRECLTWLSRCQEDDVSQSQDLTTLLTLLNAGGKEWFDITNERVTFPLLTNDRAVA